jgi:hypothetical protein
MIIKSYSVTDWYFFCKKIFSIQFVYKFCSCNILSDEVRSTAVFVEM